jgi:2-oxoglutarate ferredoxin oxidoreductase subunit alpha
MSDLDIGMNDWVTPRLQWDDAYRPDRGKVLTLEQIELLEKFYRYLPQNGSEVAARTLPGVHSNGAFFTRGSGHNKFGGYTEMPDEYQDVMDRLLRKHKEAARYVPAPIVERRSHARVGVITIGGCDPAVREALDILEQMGRPMDYMRIRAFPFHADVEAFLAEHDYCYVVEQNRDGQLCSLLTLETPVSKDKVRPILIYGGFPLSAQNVLDVVTANVEELDAIYR